MDSDSNNFGYAGGVERELSMDVREIANYLLNHCFLPSQAEELRERHSSIVDFYQSFRDGIGSV